MGNCVTSPKSQITINIHRNSETKAIVIKVDKNLTVEEACSLGGVKFIGCKSAKVTDSYSNEIEKATKLSDLKNTITCSATGALVLFVNENRVRPPPPKPSKVVSPPKEKEYDLTLSLEFPEPMKPNRKELIVVLPAKNMQQRLEVNKEQTIEEIIVSLRKRGEITERLQEIDSVNMTTGEVVSHKIKKGQLAEGHRIGLHTRELYVRVRSTTKLLAVSELVVCVGKDRTVDDLMRHLVDTEVLKRTIKPTVYQIKKKYSLEVVSPEAVLRTLRRSN